MSTLFISDLHLEDSRSDISGWMLEFLAGPARSAEALYILGDLFEYWIGDDALSPTAKALAEHTAALAEGGLKIFFQHGNRDFLLGESYAAAAGLELLPEYHVADLYGRPTLLLHGDSLCTDDTEYQAFRKQSRNTQWQAAVLAMSVPERIAMAKGAREASAEHKDASSMEIMDVNNDAVLKAFTEHGVTRMIHGHTHRPAVHLHSLPDGSKATRYVLSDWYEAGSYLEVTAEGIASRPV